MDQLSLFTPEKKQHLQNAATTRAAWLEAEHFRYRQVLEAVTETESLSRQLQESQKRLELLKRRYLTVIQPGHDAAADAWMSLFAAVEQALNSSKFRKKIDREKMLAIMQYAAGAMEIRHGRDASGLMDKYYDELGTTASKNGETDELDTLFEDDDEDKEYCRSRRKKSTRFDGADGDIRRGSPPRAENSGQPYRHKTKAQLKKEEKERALAAEIQLMRKCVKSLYLNLAKVFHPDREQDVSRRHLKEELMKRVTGAYHRHDFCGMLKLAGDNPFVQPEAIIGSLDGPAAGRYLKILQEQQQEIRWEISSLAHGPEGLFISQFGENTEDVESSLRKVKAQMEREAKHAGKMAECLRQPDLLRDFLDLMDMAPLDLLMESQWYLKTSLLEKTRGRSQSKRKTTRVRARKAGK